ncbi:MAG: Cytochrome P450 4f11 [Paramarteilia canceri]
MILLLLASIFSNLTTSIKYGKNASVQEGKFIVQIIKPVDVGKIRHICTGFIIDKNFVLTAAHCKEEIKDEINSIQIIPAGIKSDQEAYNRMRGVSEFIEYDGPLVIRHHADIALIRLNESLVFGDEVGKINLVSNDNRNIYSHSDCKMIGWGIDETSRIPNELKTIEQYFYTEQCHRSETIGETSYLYATSYYSKVNRHYSNADRIPIIADGDSGGPLVCKSVNQDIVVIGVASALINCEISSVKVAAYLNITNFLDWIYENIREQKEPKQGQESEVADRKSKLVEDRNFEEEISSNKTKKVLIYLWLAISICLFVVVIVLIIYFLFL